MYPYAAHSTPIMFDGEDMRIEIGDPLSPLHCLVKRDDRVTNIGLYSRPKKRRIALNQIRGCLIPEVLVKTHELMEQCIQLARIKRISDLLPSAPAGLSFATGSSDRPRLRGRHVLQCPLPEA